MGTVKRNSILIIDDEKSNLMYLNSILSTDYSIFIAKGGREALAKASELVPDLILLDIIMPGMDGYEVLTELRSQESTRRTPVIFITGLDSSEDEERGLALSAADYIIKPFRAAIVRLRVSNQIRLINQMREIEGLSRTDQLTGIANRRMFDQQIENEWRRSVRYQTPLSLLMIDVDKFKNYNDTYGHQQGDAVLQVVAGALTRTLKRPADLAARWGGEEFAVLLPVTDAKGAAVIAESIRNSIESAEMQCPDGTITKVTVSIGVNSRTPEKDDIIDEFISKADAALYTAKEMGRNRVCFGVE